MSITDQWSSDLGKMVSDMPSSLVWGGQTVSCTASPVMRNDEVDTSGIFQAHALEVVASVSSFDTLPTIRAVVQVDGVKYAVTERELDGAGVRFTLRRI